MRTSTSMKGGSPYPKKESKETSPKVIDAVYEILQSSNKTISQLIELTGASYTPVTKAVQDLYKRKLISCVGAVEAPGRAAAAVWGVTEGEGIDVSAVRCPEKRMENDVKKVRATTAESIKSLMAKGPQTPFSWLLEAAEKRPAYVGD